MNAEISDFEHEHTLSRSDLPTNPMQLVGQWFLQALHGEQLEPNAIALATSTPDGQPSIRMVLLKEFDDTGVVFFTNYESRKAQELEQNPKASILMWWSDVQRQIRLEGVVEKVTAEEADDYFGTRPRGSQLGAWASAQSREIPDRQALEDRVAEFEAQYAGKDVPRPPNWGGYRLKPHRIEFWQGRDSRLHDRLVYERAGNGWEIKRLAP